MKLKNLKPGDMVMRDLEEASPLLYERRVETTMLDENGKPLPSSCGRRGGLF